MRLLIPAFMAVAPNHQGTGLVSVKVKVAWRLRMFSVHYIVCRYTRVYMSICAPTSYIRLESW